MIFLFNTPVLAGFGNYLIPLQIGSRDMAFPRLNAFSYWVFLFAGLLLYSSVLIGHPPDGGWFAYVPLTGKAYSPGINIDFWGLSIIFVGISTTVGAVNFIVTIFKFRAPGMTFNRMPMFVWSMLVFSFMVIFAVPAVTIAAALLELDRLFGTAFYTTTAGGSALLYQHLFWFWGHPEVYILFVPATGMVSMMVVGVLASALAGYVWIATSLVVGRLHQLRRVGPPHVRHRPAAAGARVLLRGEPAHHDPERGAVLRVDRDDVEGQGRADGADALHRRVPADLPARRHHRRDGVDPAVRLGGDRQLLHRCAPALRVERRGRVPDLRRDLLLDAEDDGRACSTSGSARSASGSCSSASTSRSSRCTSSGVLGMPRRVWTYSNGLGWDTLNVIVSIGSVVFGLGTGITLLNWALSMRRGRPAPADPWGADSLEWSISSPPPEYNFAEIPTVSSRHPLWEGGAPLALPSLDENAATHRPAVRSLALEGAFEKTSTITSGRDTRPSDVLEIPEQTVVPLAVAFGLAVFFVGLLIDASVVGVIGLSLAVVAVLRWLWRPRWTGREEASGPRSTKPFRDVARCRRSLTPTTKPVHSTAWWGMATLIATESMIFVILLGAYFFLRASSTHWPPAGSPPPELKLAVPFSFVLWGSSIPIFYAEAAIRRGSQRGLRAGLLVERVHGRRVPRVHGEGLPRPDVRLARQRVRVDLLHDRRTARRRTCSSVCA